MKIGATIFIVIIACGIIAVQSLHRDGNQAQQLQALKDKQKYLSQQLANLNANSASVKIKLQNASSDKQKVQILQSTLRLQRQQIFDLKNKIILPFNQSQTACQQLTDKQKEILLQKIEITRTKLKQLQEINSKLNQSLIKVKDISSSIQKQYILLQNMEDILKIKCKENLSPTIFQSNLNAKNWILGPQTMNDLEQQYAQRALIFHNITNCPLETPFYSPDIQQCIDCKQPNPIFNMYSKQCTKCDLDEQLDQEKRVCRTKPHYTNFSKLQNWNLQGGKLPQINKNLTPCADSKPYFNGIICVPCDLPLYWSVSANLCKQCPKGTSFDLNTKNCQQIVKYQLTILQNTKWVSQNLTKIVEERANVLQKNKTSGNYHYCPHITSPYYDRTTCISCQYFDIDNYKCISKPQGFQYDQNMRRFLTPETNKQTNINAKRYTTTNKLVDSSVPNCNQTYPYYDGVACIQCLKPFDIFDVDKKQCTACNYDQIYVQDAHICKPRRKIKISDNFDKLLATPKVTVPQYKQSLIKTINDNSDAIITPCPQKNQYSNLNDCFPCKDRQYFNVQTLKCEFCDGIYVDSNNTCKYNVYIFTNLKAGRIVDMEGTTIQNQNTKISQFLKTHPDSYVCPLDKPYAIENKTCGVCPDLFSYSELKCKSCSQFYIYVADSQKCLQAKMSVNFTDAHKILVSKNQTLTSFKEKELSVKNQFPNLWKICPGDRPYTDNRRESCFNCTQPKPYFNYTAKQCQSCPDHYVFDPVTVRCVQQFFITLINSNTEPRMLGYDNYTLGQYKIQQDQFKRSHPYVNCTSDAPFGVATGCKQCNQPTSYFDIKKKQCSDVKFLINFQKISPQYILPKDRNLDSYIADQEKYRREATFLTKKCPDDKPYTSDRNNCFNCSVGQYFSFITKKCQKCPDGQQYVKNTKSCQRLFYITKINNVTEPNMKGYANYTVDDYKRDIKLKVPAKECPDEEPYGTIDGCRKCQEPTPYFDVKKLICSSAKQTINFPNIGQNYILDQGKTVSMYEQSQKNFKLYSESLTVQCPKQRPFTSDRNSCFVCKQPEYLFNFQTKRCQACPRGTQFQTQKKRCLRQFYITNFTDESQQKMVESKDYTIADFKANQEKLRRQNPYVNCTKEQPYGTIDGCKKCFIPQEYFDIKNRVCTSVKRLINFDAVSKNYITKDPKKIQDYRRQEEDFKSKSEAPAVVCPPQTPFTSNRNDCFACKDPQLYFNFETRTCQGCDANQAYDPLTNKCILKQYYTLFNSNTQNKLLESGNMTVENYKIDQGKIKQMTGSSQCPSAQPFATSTVCIQCNGTTPYFNMDLKKCQGCESGMKFFESKHKCLLPAYMTDFTNPNIKEADNFTIADAKKIQQQRAAKEGYTAVQCTSQKPFAALDGCISCDNSSAPYFNIKTLTCEGCRQFYQRFQDHVCKDNIILTNTKKMIGYLEVDNYTKYNVQKQNNFTFVMNKHVYDCPQQTPFYYQAQKTCISCNSSAQPIFDLSKKKCVAVTQLRKSNLDAMKYYIQQGDATLADQQNQINVLKQRGVKIIICPADKPYFSNNQCITCPDSQKYFNIATQVCKTCQAGDICKQK